MFGIRSNCQILLNGMSYFLTGILTLGGRKPFSPRNELGLPFACFTQELEILRPLLIDLYFIRWSALSKSETLEGSTSPETDIVQWTFKDGTVLEIKQEEHSVCAHFNNLSAYPSLLHHQTFTIFYFS